MIVYAPVFRRDLSGTGTVFTNAFLIRAASHSKTMARVRIRNFELVSSWLVFYRLELKAPADCVLPINSKPFGQQETSHEKSSARVQAITECKIVWAAGFTVIYSWWWRWGVVAESKLCFPKVRFVVLTSFLDNLCFAIGFWMVRSINMAPRARTRGDDTRQPTTKRFFFQMSVREIYVYVI